MDLDRRYTYSLDRSIMHLCSDDMKDMTLQDLFEDLIPSKRVRGMLVSGLVTSEGRSLKADDRLSANGIDIVIYRPHEPYGYIPELPEILYEDELIVAVHKERGMLVHTDGSSRPNLTDRVRSLYLRTDIDPLPLHRLDRETAGIVLFSKSFVFQPLLDSMMENKEIRRTYEALVRGKFDEGLSKIDLPIGRNRHESGKYIVSATGKKAVTHVSFEDYSKRYDISKVRCVLDTGRTHQIRVHLSHMGYPIVNDDLYGELEPAVSGMGLSAAEMTLIHPLSKERIVIRDKRDDDWEGLFL